MDKYKIISDVRDVFPTIDTFLMENGNKKLKQELDSWNGNNQMFVYENKLFFNKDQMKVIKKYTFNLKTEKEQDYFFIQNESGGKDRVIWIHSDDYQSMQKQKNGKEKWDKEQEEKAKRIHDQIEDLKAKKDISQPSKIKIPSKVFEDTIATHNDFDRMEILLKILNDCGVELFSFGFKNLDGLKWDWNQINEADEKTYIQYKYNIR